MTKLTNVENPLAAPSSKPKKTLNKKGRSMAQMANSGDKAVKVDRTLEASIAASLAGQPVPGAQPAAAQQPAFFQKPPDPFANFGGQPQAGKVHSRSLFFLLKPTPRFV